MTRISVEVSLADFSDLEILQAALSIIREPAGKRDFDCELVVGSIAMALDEDPTLPPISTAARVHSLAELHEIAEGFAQ